MQRCANNTGRAGHENSIVNDGSNNNESPEAATTENHYDPYKSGKGYADLRKANKYNGAEHHDCVFVMIKLYQYELSPFCSKIALILNVKNVPYETIEVPVSKSGAVKKYSPTSKLPTILHDGRYIDDSTDIAYYLEEVFPDPPLIPKEPKARAKCHVYEDWADESLNFYMMKLRWLPQNRARWAKELAKHDTGLWRWLIASFAARATLNILDKQGIGRKTEAAILIDIDRHMRALSADLHGDRFLAGEQLSLADISVFVQLEWMRENPEGTAAVSKYKNVLQWMDRVRAATGKNA